MSIMFDLRESLLKEHSKAQCAVIVDWIGHSQQRFDSLFNLFLNDDYRVVQRASWPLSYSVLAHPELIKKHFTKLLDNLRKPGIHSAVKRNTVRLLQDIEIPKRFHGRVMDFCFSYIMSPSEPVAVKAFSLSILQNLAGQYPEIVPEIKLVIEEQLPHQTAAFKSRAKVFFKKFK